MTNPAFHLVVHRDARPWLPSEDDLDRLRGHFPFPDVTVKLWPRREVDRVLGRRTTPYAFRAVSQGSTTDIFVDDTETPASIAWLLAHELGHHRVKRLPEIKTILEVTRADDADRSGQSDRFHELDPEERLVDGLATTILGTRYDRTWWRARTKERTRAIYGATPRATSWLFPVR